MGLRLLDAAMAVVFALFAVLQVNDPAPGNVPWVLVYAAGAVLCALAAAGRPVGLAPFGLAAVATLWAAYLLIGVMAGGGSPFDLHVGDMEVGGEEQREAVGLLILAAYAAWLGGRERRRGRAADAG